MLRSAYAEEQTDHSLLSCVNTICKTAANDKFCDIFLELGDNLHGVLKEATKF